MLVTENIQFAVAGDTIKHGIFRDFPTDYTDPSGRPYRVGFTVEETLLDGESEPHLVQNLSGGKRVRIGSPRRTISPGNHTWTIRYRTTGQLGFFQDHDELYWNATGNLWPYSIERAAAAVSLPDGAKILRLGGYTGPEGARGGDFTAQSATEGKAVFRTTRPLAPREGLTIVLGWEKGAVRPPATGRNEVPGTGMPVNAKPGFSDKLRLNSWLLAAGAAALASLGLLGGGWWRYGRDPARGTIIPLYEPPDNLSPAACRYLREMGFDDRTFTAVLLGLAAKGLMTIREKKGTFSLDKTGKGKVPATGEREALEKLLGEDSSLILDKSNYSKISSARLEAKKALDDAYEGWGFRLNTGIWVGGAALALAATVLAFFNRPETVGLAIMLAVGGGIALWGLKSLIERFKAGKLFRGMFLLELMVFFLGGGVAGGAVAALVEAAGPALPIGIALLWTAVLVFLFLLRQPTTAGQKLRDGIEGFRMYLETAEGDRLDFENRPELTTELFERYLPYAIALEVEQPWSEKFSRQLTRAGQPPWRGEVSWYRGNREVVSLGSTLGGSLVAARAGARRKTFFSSTRSSPGSFSGFSSGGFSGGGGGGGGGGGW